MDAAKRENIWRISVVAIAVISVVISALAYYGVRRLEKDNKPRVHLIREVNKFQVEAKPDSKSTQPPAK
jgi:hypothetical protein